MSIKSMEGMSARAEMCNAAELRAVGLSPSHQFEDEIGTLSSENRLLIPKMEFSVRYGQPKRRLELALKRSA